MKDSIISNDIEQLVKSLESFFEDEAVDDHQNDFLCKFTKLRKDSSKDSKKVSNSKNCNSKVLTFKITNSNQSIKLCFE